MLLWPRIAGRPAPVTVGFAPRAGGGGFFDCFADF